MGALEIDAELMVSHNDIHFALVAQGNQLAVSFRNLADLEKLMADLGSSSSQKAASPGTGKSGGISGGLQKLEEANATVRALQLNVKIVVGGKTYLELGGRSYRITMAAVFGKLGSFFK